MAPVLTRTRARLFLWLVLCGLGRAAAAIAAALLIRGAFDALSGHVPAPVGAEVWLLLAEFALVGAALLAIQVVERASADKLGHDYAAAVRLRLFDHLAVVPLRALRSRRMGHLMVRFVGDLTAVRLWVSRGLAPMIVAGIAIPAALAALTLIDGHLALLVTAVLAVVGTVTAALGRPLQRRVRTMRRRRAQLSGNLGEKLQALPAIRTLGRAGRERRRLKKQNRRIRDAATARARLAGLVRGLPEASNTLAAGFVIVLGFEAVAEGTTTPGTLLAALTVLGILAPTLAELARAFDYRQGYTVAREKILKLLALPSLDTGRRTAELQVTAGAVQLEQVGVDGSLDEVTARARPRQIVGLIGPNGAGKSTILNAIAGLIIPDRGRILIDGHDLAHCRLGSLSRAIGMVSPDLPLLRGSVDWNLRYRHPDATEEEVLRVIELCQLDALLASLPGGRHAALLEGGRNLSSGMRQRLALARALLGEPRILLLDEVDAELDGEARKVVDALLRRRLATTFMVTHDPRRLATLDAVWHLDGGRLVEVGTPGDVLGPERPTRRPFDARSDRLQALPPASRAS